MLPTSPGPKVVIGHEKFSIFVSLTMKMSSFTLRLGVTHAKKLHYCTVFILLRIHRTLIFVTSENHQDCEYRANIEYIHFYRIYPLSQITQHAMLLGR